MRLSQVLYKHNIGRQIRNLWYVQGKRTPIEMFTEKILLKRGIEVIDPPDFFKINNKPPKHDCSLFSPLKTRAPMNPPREGWKDVSCLKYTDNELLVLGLPQAQLITKTIVFKDNLESSKEDVTEETDQIVQRSIQTAIMFDAKQEKLPKVKNPNKIEWVYPRSYGITPIRKITNLTRKLVQLCDCVSGPQIANTRSIIDNALISFSFEKEFDHYQFSLTMDLMLMSEKPLKPINERIEDHNATTLPDIYPMHHTIGLTIETGYDPKDLYPIVSGYHKKNVHTIFISHDDLTVKNITELPVTGKQKLARTMIKAFTAASSFARQKFGKDVKDLPEPITVQCVQSNGQEYHFSIYQLNTLNIDGDEGIKNYWWTSPTINLYQYGGYLEGRPTLDGYNPEVFQRILAFYKNN